MPELTLLYRDEHLVACMKPSGMLVHRGWGRDDVVAMDLARDQCGQWVYPVHRLDRGTSGVLLFALSSEIAGVIQRQFEAGSIRKRYLALVRGRAPEAGTIDHPIPRTEGGERVPAVTGYRRLFVVEEPGPYSFVEATPETGRMHQIRRHLKHLGHPLIGDVNYGRSEHNRFFRAEYGMHRLALHSLEMELLHPATGAALRLFAPLPEDLASPLRQLGVPASAWGAVL